VHVINTKKKAGVSTLGTKCEKVLFGLPDLTLTMLHSGPLQPPVSFTMLTVWSGLASLGPTTCSVVLRDTVPGPCMDTATLCGAM